MKTATKTSSISHVTKMMSRKMYHLASLAAFLTACFQEDVREINITGRGLRVLELPTDDPGTSPAPDLCWCTDI